MSLDRLQETSGVSVKGVTLPLSIASGALPIWHDQAFMPASDALVHFEALIPLTRAAGQPAGRNRSSWDEAAFAVHSLRSNCIAYRLVKRILDIVIVVALSPLLVPLMIGIALLVRRSSVGPILYRHRRIGRFGKEFTMWKFRSMHVQGDDILRNYFEQNPGAAEEWRRSHKLKDDPRITSIGRFLRSNSLDELPQFINVLLGSMSLVGPRPIVEEEVRKYGESYFFYTSAKPGLSGLWQVSGRCSIAYEERVALDKDYIRNWSLGMDLGILWRTAGAVWLKQGAH